MEEDGDHPEVGMNNMLKTTGLLYSKNRPRNGLEKMFIEWRQRQEESSTCNEVTWKLALRWNQLLLKKLAPILSGSSYSAEFSVVLVSRSRFSADQPSVIAAIDV